MQGLKKSAIVEDPVVPLQWQEVIMMKIVLYVTNIQILLKIILNTAKRQRM